MRFCEFRVRPGVFLVPWMFYTPFSSNVCHFSWKSASRPRWGAWFWKLHKGIIMSKRSSQALQLHEISPFWGCLWNFEFAKSIGKMNISCLWTLFGSLVRTMWSIACIFYAIFTFSSCFRHHLKNWPHSRKSHRIVTEKLTPLSEVSSHSYWKIDPAFGSLIA